MFITTADAVQIREAYAKLGRDAALAEIRRRVPLLVENATDKVLRYVLSAKVAAPPAWRGRDLDALDLAGRAAHPQKERPRRLVGRPRRARQRPAGGRNSSAPGEGSLESAGS